MQRATHRARARAAPASLPLRHADLSWRGARRSARPPPPWQRGTHACIRSAHMHSPVDVGMTRPCSECVSSAAIRSSRPAKHAGRAHGRVRVARTRPEHRPLSPGDERPAARGPEGDSRRVLALGHAPWPTGGLGPGGGGAPAGSSRAPAVQGGCMYYSSVPQGPNREQRIRDRGAETAKARLRSSAGRVPSQFKTHIVVFVSPGDLQAPAPPSSRPA